MTALSWPRAGILPAWARVALLNLSIVAAIHGCDERAPAGQPPSPQPVTSETLDTGVSAQPAAVARVEAGAASATDGAADRPSDAGSSDAGSAVDAQGVMPSEAGVADARVPEASVGTDSALPLAMDAGATAPDAGGRSDAGTAMIKVEQLITPQAMPISERGVYTDNGRFFVVGGNVLYEIVAEGAGFKAVELLREACVLGGAVDRGNLLYIGCRYDEEGDDPELLRFDPQLSGAARVQRVVLPGLPVPALVNGMEFGPDGALYFSDSGLLFSGGSIAVYRAEITSEAPLTVRLTPFADDEALGGTTAPNGIRFEGNNMYVSTGTSLVRAELRAGGMHGPFETVYELLPLYSIDDLDILEKRLFIARADGLPVIAATLFGGSSREGAPMVVATLDGKVEREIPLPVVPSSTAARRNTLFGAATVIVTSYFNGGLYRVTGAY